MAMPAALAATLGIAALPGVAIGHGGNPNGGNPSGGSHKCTPHSQGYEAAGTVDASSTSALTANSDGTYSGALVVDVKHANHHGQTGTVTYTLDHATVKFHHGAGNPPAAGTRAQLHGKVTELNRQCDQTGFTPTVSIKKVDLNGSGPSGGSGGHGSSGSDGSGADN